MSDPMQSLDLGMYELLDSVLGSVVDSMDDSVDPGVWLPVDELLEDAVWNAVKRFSLLGVEEQLQTDHRRFGSFLT